MSQDTTIYTAKPEILTVPEILGLLDPRGLHAEWRPTYPSQPDVPNGVFNVTGGSGEPSQIQISSQNVPDYERDGILRTFGGALSDEKRQAIVETKTSYTVSRSWSRDPVRDYWSDHMISLLAAATAGLIYDHQDDRFYSVSEFRAKHASTVGSDPTVM